MPTIDRTAPRAPRDSTAWAAFRLLERAAALRNPATPGVLYGELPVQAQPALWLFVATQGELNAVRPLVDWLCAEAPALSLVLITDQAQYVANYRRLYPASRVWVSGGGSGEAPELARRLPPRLLVVAEIPALPADAPCRFAYGFVRAARRRGAGVALVNGWLYRQAPGCRMDTIERRWFQRHYARSFDVLCVQREQERTLLLTAGAEPARVVVTGNLKFDAVDRCEWQPAQARSPKMLAALLAAQRPTVVAGCVTSDEEQRMVLEAMRVVHAHRPDALLVLAPRYPQRQDRMVALRALLAEHSMPALYRSAWGDRELPANAPCLVLDTIGDLRDFYAAATVAHVGRNHNLLEPLAFDKPVTMLPGWNAIYPSYPVHQVLHAAAAISEAADAPALVASWLGALSNDAETHALRERAASTLDSARGSFALHKTALWPLIEQYTV
jgi:3-deoxy-D-manno-octulosonic-acid transferase